MKIQMCGRLLIVLNILGKNVFVYILGFAFEKDGNMSALIAENELLGAVVDKNLKNNDLVLAAWIKDFVIFDDFICVNHKTKLFKRNEYNFFENCGKA